MNKKIYFALAIIALVIGVFIYKNFATSNFVQQKNTSVENMLTFNLIINTGTESHSFTEKIKPGSNAFEALRLASQKEAFAITFQDSAQGAFVNSIYDIQPEGAKYWMFKINGKLSDVGASSYTVKAGDTIEWIYMDTTGLF